MDLAVNTLTVIGVNVLLFWHSFMGNIVTRKTSYMPAVMSQLGIILISAR